MRLPVHLDTDKWAILGADRDVIAKVFLLPDGQAIAAAVNHVDALASRLDDLVRRFDEVIVTDDVAVLLDAARARLAAYKRDKALAAYDADRGEPAKEG